jgi:predicted Zn-dependent protease
VVAVGAALLAGSACDSPTVPADTASYDPRFPGTSGERLVYHWPLGRAIGVYVDPRGAPAGLDLAAAVRDGGDHWATVVFYREFTLRLVGDAAAADVIVHFDAAPPLLSPVCPSTAVIAGPAGVTTACPDESRREFVPFEFADGQASHVKMDVTISSDPAVVPNAARLLTIVTHELGHVIGIGAHSPNNLDIMFGAPTERFPGAGDARTLRWVLHQPVDLRL